MRGPVVAPTASCTSPSCSGSRGRGSAPAPPGRCRRLRGIGVPLCPPVGAGLSLHGPRGFIGPGGDLGKQRPASIRSQVSPSPTPLVPFQFDVGVPEYECRVVPVPGGHPDHPRMDADATELPAAPVLRMGDVVDAEFRRQLRHVTTHPVEGRSDGPSPGGNCLRSPPRPHSSGTAATAE